MLRLMTYNIQHGIDYVHRLTKKEVVINLDKIVEIIKSVNPDIVSLNEVYDAPVEFLEKQAEYIATKLGYYFVFGKAINIKGGEYGNALLSRYPLCDVSIIPIPDALTHNEPVFYESRSIIKTYINKEKKKYHIFVSHFGLAKEEQDNGTALIKELVNNLDNVIFMGDLNLTPNDKNYYEITKVLKNTVDENIKTFPSINPISRIDYIFISKDINVIKGEVLKNVFSDHLPITVDIE